MNNNNRIIRTIRAKFFHSTATISARFINIKPHVNGRNNFQQCWDLQCILGRIQPARPWRPLACCKKEQGARGRARGESLPLNPYIINWWLGFLRDRKQRVIFGSSVCDWKTVNKGTRHLVLNMLMTVRLLLRYMMI